MTPILFFIFICILALWFLNQAMILTKSNLSKTELIRFEAFFLNLVTKELEDITKCNKNLFDLEEDFLDLVKKLRSNFLEDSKKSGMRQQAKIVAMSLRIEELAKLEREKV